MNNSIIELELIQHFGLDKTISFCEMVSMMYDIMHNDVVERGLATEFGYDFDRDWWKQKYSELKNIANGTKGFTKIVSSSGGCRKKVSNR